MQTDITKLSNDEIKAEAQKIQTRRAAQRDRMKARSKEKRAYEKQLLAVAEQKNLLPNGGKSARKA